VFAQPGIGSNIARNSRRAVEGAQGAIDQLVFQVVERTLQREQPGTSASMLALPGSVLFDKPERLFDGRQIALPGTVVDAIDAIRATHLIVLTKWRDAVRAPLQDGTVGVGNVRGLGFYVDSDIRVVMRESGHIGSGLLAPFVYVRMTLVDAQNGDVIREETVRSMQTYSTASNPKAVIPWDVLSAQEKIEALQQLIDRSIGEATTRLLR
jgi:hypothetical protein